MKLRLLALIAAALLAGIPSGPALGSPGDAEATVSRAREAARRDANAEAADLFREAISQAPSRRLEWLRELADQMTYSGQAVEAVPCYQEVLADPSFPPEERRRARLGLALALSWCGRPKESLGEYDAMLAQDPADVEAMLGRARVLSWLGRNTESREAYEEVLRREPGNADALRGLGRLESWRGRQRGAQRLLSGFLERHPGDSEGTFLLAQSQDWMGRPDRAKQTLQGQPVALTEGTQIPGLLEQIELRERPDSRIGYRQSHQSDDLVIQTSFFEQDVRFNDGLTTIGARLQFQRYHSQHAGESDVTVKRPGLFARHRFNDSLEWTTGLYLDRIEPEDTGESHSDLTYDTYLTYWPGDLLRFDFGSSRTTFDNLKSLRQNITATYANVSMDVTPDDSMRFSTRFNWGDYSDGNRRLWGQVEGWRRVSFRPKLFLGLQVTAFNFSRFLDNGYFNPEDYISGALAFRTTGQAWERLSYDVTASWGAESATPEGRKAIWSAGTRLAWQASDHFEIVAQYGYFSSAVASSSGFARGTGDIFLRIIW